tara:strand:+ start:427 stop:603 length:177 start_codon:yes stop_codon:yes gene_type:complete
MMRLFRKRENQNEKLLRKIKEYEQKEKAKQQESKIHGQKPVKQKANKEKSTIQRGEGS